MQIFLEPHMIFFSTLIDLSLTKTTSFKTALQNGFKHPIHTNVGNKK